MTFVSLNSKANRVRNDSWDVVLSTGGQRVIHLLLTGQISSPDLLTWPALNVVGPNVGSIGTRKFDGVVAASECSQEPIFGNHYMVLREFRTTRLHTDPGHEAYVRRL
jgi:hypothetical protein